MSGSIHAQILAKALELVGRRSTWTRHTLAQTRNRQEIDPTHPDASRFCGFGAMIRAAHLLTGDADKARLLAGQTAMRITGRATPEQAYMDIYTLNDGPPIASRKAIMKLFEDNLLHG